MDESRARALLLAERAEVIAALREAEEERQEPSADPVELGPGDAVDRTVPIDEREQAEDIAAQLQERLEAIDRALARLEAGTYGRSVLSGKPIPDERLEADPAAELTIEEARAQQRR
jgi:DnaK suppressor protein